MKGGIYGFATRNHSKIVLEVDRLEVFRIYGCRKRKSAYQEIRMVPGHR
ncbi:hypothetical protein GO009_16700 [Muricauda sp. TY007]|nr:hypothetical protein [Muricauda sp. TY007]NDV17659.1 hypothetical protein [Muricauda sp. TY007]